jgi:hypothetical protein
MAEVVRWLDGLFAAKIITVIFLAGLFCETTFPLGNIPSYLLLHGSSGMISLVSEYSYRHSYRFSLTYFRVDQQTRTHDRVNFQQHDKRLQQLHLTM